MFYLKNVFKKSNLNFQRELNGFRRKGFTLIELLVVIAIIGLLASIVLVSMGGVRGKARDAKRMQELNQIAKAVQLYWSDNGYYPKEADGANGEVGEGAGLDTMLAPYMTVFSDPLGPGDSTHYYYYDGRQNCTDAGGTLRQVAVIFAKTLEAQPSNSSELCPGGWGGEGGAGNSKAWHIILGPSDG